MAMTEPAAGLLMITWQNALQIGVASARTLEIIRTPVCEPLTKVKTVYFACLRTKMGENITTCQHFFAKQPRQLCGQRKSS